MSRARLVITAITVEKRPVSEVARSYGVARSWICTLLARYEAGGEVSAGTVKTWRHAGLVSGQYATHGAAPAAAGRPPANGRPLRHAPPQSHSVAGRASRRQSPWPGAEILASRGECSTQRRMRSRDTPQARPVRGRP
jgi:hypothetical protein